MSFSHAFRWLPIAVLCLCACAEMPATGGVEVLLSVDLGDEPTFASFMISPSQVTFHVTGTSLVEAWQGTERPEGAWLPLSTADAQIDLVRVSEESEWLLLAGSLPCGSYDHLFLELDNVISRSSDGLVLETTNIVEPIAVPFEILEGQTQTLHLELVVLPRWPSEDGVSIFAKKAFSSRP